MTYGDEIRKTRKLLGCIQSDIGNENLSRNQLSNIEKNNTTLVPSKAFIIYKRLIELSWIKSIPINIEFDEILSENTSYNLLKKANDICLYLDGLDTHTILNLDELDKYRNFAKKNDVGILKYFILTKCAHFYGLINNADLKCSSYFDALEALNYNDESIIPLYSNTLKEVKLPADKTEQIKLLIYYYKILIEMQQNFSSKVEYQLYYDIALLSKIDEDYTQAIDYIDLYLESSENLSTLKIADCKILKASILNITGRCDKSLNIYSEVLNDLQGTEFYHQISSCINNSINCIVKNEMPNMHNLVSDYNTQLLNIVDEIYNSSIDKQNLFSNIAQGSSYLGDYNIAEYYFARAFTEIQNDDDNIKLITLLKESLKTYLHLGKVDLIITKILGIDLDKTTEDATLIMFYIIVKTQNYISNTSYESTLLLPFNQYVDSL